MDWGELNQAVEKDLSTLLLLSRGTWKITNKSNPRQPLSLQNKLTTKIINLVPENISITNVPFEFLLSGIGNLTEGYISCTGEGKNPLSLILMCWC